MTCHFWDSRLCHAEDMAPYDTLPVEVRTGHHLVCGSRSM